MEDPKGELIYTHTEEDICEEKIYTDNSLMTRENFGCVLHEEGENRK